MIHRSMTFDGVDLVEDLGLHYSSFDEKLPEPKTAYVDVVAGTDIDLTEANGVIAYGDGEHTLIFLSLADTEEERIETRNKVLSLTHGKRAQYFLSWRQGAFTGRCVTTVRHLTPLADLFTLTIRRSPYSQFSGQVLEYATSEVAGNKLQLTFFMPAPATYSLVRVYPTQAAVASGFDNTVDCPSAGMYTLLTGSKKPVTGSSHPVTLVYSDWWAYLNDDGDRIKLNTSHATISGDTVTLDNTWTLSTDNYKSPNVSGKVTYTMAVL